MASEFALNALLLIADCTSDCVEKFTRQAGFRTSIKGFSAGVPVKSWSVVDGAAAGASGVTSTGVPVSPSGVPSTQDELPSEPTVGWSVGSLLMPPIGPVLWAPVRSSSG